MTDTSITAHAQTIYVVEDQADLAQVPHPRLGIATRSSGSSTNSSIARRKARGLPSSVVMSRKTMPGFG